MRKLIRLDPLPPINSIQECDSHSFLIHLMEQTMESKIYEPYNHEYRTIDLLLDRRNQLMGDKKVS